MLAFRGVLALTPITPVDWHTRGLACLHMREFADAEAAARVALRGDPGHLSAYLLLAEALERMYRLAEASAVRAELGRRQRVVRQPCFSSHPLARVLLIAGSALCNIPTQYVLDRNRFDVTLVHLAPGPGAGDAAGLPASLPGFDVAFNVIGDADTGAPFLDEADSLCAGLPCAVLNPPPRIGPRAETACRQCSTAFRVSWCRKSAGFRVRRRRCSHGTRAPRRGHCRGSSGRWDRMAARTSGASTKPPIWPGISTRSRSTRIT
jgi:hypothetical protein